MPSILPLLYLAPGAGRMVVCLFYLPFTLRCCLSLNCQSVRPPVHLSRRSLFPQPAWIRLWDVYEVSIVSIVDGSRRRWWHWWFCTCVTWWFLALPGYLYLQFRYDRLTRLLTLLISSHMNWVAAFPAERAASLIKYTLVMVVLIVLVVNVDGPRWRR